MSAGNLATMRGRQGPVVLAALLAAVAGCSRSAGPPPASPVPQIDGSIAAVHFAEGREVAPGDALFTIDPRPFEAGVAQARANLARDRAQAERSRVDAERQAKLFAQGVASQQVVDTFRTQARLAEDAVEAGEAALRRAELDL
jgi:multidrug efflux pump subunit AcrA (membrane-fusion protein)